MTTWIDEGPVRTSTAADGTVHYLPVAPSPQLDGGGKPAASLLVAGEAAFLQLAVQWDPPSAALEAIRTLRTVEGQAPPALAPPPGLQVGQAELRAGDEVVQTARTSGFPPWTALFALSADGPLRPAAAAALRGDPGHLGVRFTAVLDGRPLVLEADVADWFATAQHPFPVASDAISHLGRFDARPTTTEGAPQC